MSAVDAAVQTIHLLVGAFWVGSVVFVTVGVLPVARDGDANAAPVERMVRRLTTISRASAVLMLITGGHLAGVGYTVENLTGTTRGHLVIGMVILWLALAGLVEVGAARLTDGLQKKKVRAPARDSDRLFWLASITGALLLVDAGLLSAGILT
jgi:uncharacterized membrane protein